MTKLKIIIGSTRPGRSSDRVTPWVIERAKEVESFDVEVLDLRDYRLPHFQETVDTIGNFMDPTYSEPIVKEWNNKIKDGDAFIIVTTEFNHSVPGELKNALDSVFVSFGFRQKPVAFVGYSNSQIAGARAVEHLAHIVIEGDGVPLRNTCLVGEVLKAFDDNGHPKNVMTEAALTVMLQDLEWMANALNPARAAGILSPGTFRAHQIAGEIRAAREAAQA